MSNERDLLSIHFDQSSAAVAIATVTIEKPYVESLYQEALQQQKQDVRVHGFVPGNTPLNYLERTYKIPIVEHLQQFFLSSCVLDFLADQLALKKIVTLGEPRLKQLKLSPQDGATFTFELDTVQVKLNQDWEKMAFRAPGRKNYHDLDKQVELFLKEEAIENAPEPETIGSNDWVCFSLQPVDKNRVPLLGSHKDIVWLKVGDEESDEDAQLLFVGKKRGDTFESRSSFLQNYASNSFDTYYTFAVTILYHLDQAKFCLESFKKHFKLKAARDVHLKLIEVFSFRHDISQRRETAEAALKTLAKTYPVSIPQHLVEKQKKMLLEQVQLNPDYYVYKTQRDFKDKIQQLAEKQLKEQALVDAIAYKENIQVTHDDIVSYLNLMKRPRTKEFIYFSLPTTKLYDCETLFSHEVMRQQCLREKTLNYLIGRMAKKIIWKFIILSSLGQGLQGLLLAFMQHEHNSSPLFLRESSRAGN